MNKDQWREIIQLILAAKHSFNLSKKLLPKIGHDSLQTKIKDLAGKFDKLTFSKDDHNLLIMVSYLSNCGIRIMTIHEILNIKPTNDELYKRKPLNPKNICFFLRDNVCHKEPGIEDKKNYKNRQDFLNELTIEQLYEYVKESLVEFKKMILEFSNNYGLLESFIKKEFKNV